MADTAFQPVYNPDDDDQTDTRPYLRAVPGGGETTEPKRGHLKSVDGGKKSSSPEELQHSEQAGGRGRHLSAVDPKEAGVAGQSNDSPFSFKNDAKNRKGIGRFLTKKGVKRGGIVGVIIGLLFGVFSILQGPFQFVHFGQVLARHFKQIDNIMDDRQLARVRYRRLGYTGNKAADIVEKNLNKAGFKSHYDSGGYFDGFEVDPSKVPADKLRGLDAELRIEGDKIFLVENGANFRRRGLVNDVLRRAGTGKIPSRISSRLLRTRGGVSFKILGNIDRKAHSTITEYWRAVQKKFSDYYKNGSGFKARARGEDKDADGNDLSDEEKAANQGAADSANQKLDEVGADTSDAGIAKSTDSLKNIGKGADLAGLVCAVRAASQSYQAMLYAKIILPLIRFATGFMSIGSQIMSGRGFPMAELGAYSQKTFDKKTKTSWASARSIQYELGQKPTGPDMPSSAKPGRIGNKPAFFQAADSIPGAGGFCKVNNSTVGGAVISLVTGGIVLEALITGLQTVGIDPLGKGMEAIIRWAVGHPLEDFPAGAMLGNYANYGSRLAANDHHIAIGARELTESEEKSVRRAALLEQKEELAAQSFYSRVLDPYNVDSAASTVMMSLPQSPSQAFMGLLQAPASLLSSLSRIGTSSAGAQVVEYDYGFALFGFTPEERNQERYQDPYANDERVEPKLEEYNKKYGKCFSTTVDPADKRIISGETVNYYAEKNENNPVGFEDCRVKPGDENYEEFTDYRFYLLDKVTERAVECYDGIEDSCNQVGYGTGGAAGNTGNPPSGEAGATIEGDPYTDSSNIACAEGTREVGKDEGWINGSSFPITVCELPNLPSSGSGDSGYARVNSRVSGAWFALVNDAIKAGVEFSVVSSYRTMASQEALWARNPDSTAVARPGYSSHQAGVALDFANIDAFTGGQDCGGGRASEPGNKYWDWLFNNASRYGFKQYSAEAWHWDAYPSSNRC